MRCLRVTSSPANGWQPRLGCHASEAGRLRAFLSETPFIISNTHIPVFLSTLSVYSFVNVLETLWLIGCLSDGTGLLTTSKRTRVNGWRERLLKFSTLRLRIWALDRPGDRASPVPGAQIRLSPVASGTSSDAGRQIPRHLARVMPTVWREIYPYDELRATCILVFAPTFCGTCHREISPRNLFLMNIEVLRR